MKRDTKIAAAVFVPIPLLILTLSSLCAVAIANGASMRWRVPFLVMCHGLVRRCLTIDGAPMPICARCVGLYAGALAGLLLFFLLPRINHRLLSIAVWIALAPLGIDGVTQAIGLRESTNTLRLATGITAGFVFGLWALSAIERRDEAAFTQS